MLRLLWPILRLLQDKPPDVDAVPILNMILGRIKAFLALLLLR